MKNIKIDYKSILKNPSEFENHILDVCKSVDIPEKTCNLDSKYYTSLEYYNTLDEDVQACRYKNLYIFDRNNSIKLLHHVSELFPNYSITPSGHFYYPKDGFMSWHTNSDTPSEHVYITYSDGYSSFNYMENNNLVVDVDDFISVRHFDTGSRGELFWHSVYSECNRYSFGYRLHKL